MPKNKNNASRKQRNLDNKKIREQISRRIRTRHYEELQEKCRSLLSDFERLIQVNNHYH